MDARDPLSEASKSSENFLPMSDSFVIVISALALGYSLGAGRWNWLGRELSRIAASLGTLMFACLIQSFQHQNPKLFKEFQAVPHEVH